MLLEAACVVAFIGLVWAGVLRLRSGAWPPGFGRFELNHPWLFVAAFFIQFLLAFLGIKQVPVIGIIFPWAYLASYLLLIFAVLKNFSRFGMTIALLGIGLNFLAILANGGHMPADAGKVRQLGKSYLLETQSYPRSRAITPDTRLPFLGDIFALTRPYPFPQIFSLGDVFVTLGVCWLILAGMGLLPEKFPGRGRQ
jgi:hypothetical protein